MIDLIGPGSGLGWVGVYISYDRRFERVGALAIVLACVHLYVDAHASETTDVQSCSYVELAIILLLFKCGQQNADRESKQCRKAQTQEAYMSNVLTRKGQTQETYMSNVPKLQGQGLMKSQKVQTTATLQGHGLTKSQKVQAMPTLQGQGWMKRQRVQAIPKRSNGGNIHSQGPWTVGAQF